MCRNDATESIARNRSRLEATLEAIGGRWKGLILHELFNGTRRFGELHRGLHGITPKMLTQQLREMERDGLINREVYVLQRLNILSRL